MCIRDRVWVCLPSLGWWLGCRVDANLAWSTGWGHPWDIRGRRAPAGPEIVVLGLGLETFMGGRFWRQDARTLICVYSRVRSYCLRSRLQAP
eukprot:3084990-Pyramimonas_sp.AAC.1